jgi:hypothetical protein
LRSGRRDPTGIHSNSVMITDLITLWLIMDG